MSNMHLVTGYAGQAHVTAADHGSLYAALVGSGIYVMDKGNKFALSKISNNLIRVLDGDLLMQGRHIRIPDAAYVELAVENGTQGYKRSDLVCVRYTKNSDTGVEESNLVILRGNPVAADPADPAYITGNILDGDLQHDFPLYRLNFNGLDIASIDTLFEVSVLTGKDASDKVRELLSNVAGNTAQIETIETQLAGMGSSVKIATGKYTGTGTKGESNKTKITFPFAPKFVHVLPNESSSFGSLGNGNLPLVYGMTEAPSLDVKWGENNVSFWATGNTVTAWTQFNNSGTVYHWVAIG